MNVKTLIEHLLKHDPERVVVLSLDSEGNSFAELTDIQPMQYDGKGIGFSELNDGLREMGFSKDDVIKGKKALIFWP